MPGSSTTTRSPSWNLFVERRFLIQLTLLLGTLLPLSGCAVLGRCTNRDHIAGAPRPRFSADPQVEEVVDYLNQNTEKLHAWKAHSIRIRANNLPGLSGSMAVEEGKHLRMVVNSIAGHEVDMGSNNDVFWIWAKRMEPSYVFCRHEQIETARQSMGIPFEPNWLMQALGVAPLDTTDLKMQVDPSRQRARLVQTAVTAHGHPIEKVMHVDLVHGIITEHCVYDAHGAKIAQAQLSEFRVDNATGVILPHRVKLDWPQNKMSLVMNFGHVDINPKISSQIWEMPPPMPGVQIVDLGKGARDISRIADARDEASEHLTQPEETTTEEEDSGRVFLTFDDADSSDTDSPMDSSDSVSPVEHKTTPIERPVSAAPKTAAKKKPEIEWWQ